MARRSRALKLDALGVGGDGKGRAAGGVAEEGVVGERTSVAPICNSSQSVCTLSCC